MNPMFDNNTFKGLINSVLKIDPVLKLSLKGLKIKHMEILLFDRSESKQ